MVNKNNPINNPKELNGKTIAFPAPNALGATLMVRADLKDKFNIQYKPRYVKTHPSVYLNVILDQTSAGGGVLGTLNRQSIEIKNNLKVIHETEKVSPHPFAVHPRVPQDVAKSVKEALLEIGESDQGKEWLRKTPISEIGVVNIESYYGLNKMNLERFLK